MDSASGRGTDCKAGAGLRDRRKDVNRIATCSGISLAWAEMDVQRGSRRTVIAVLLCLLNAPAIFSSHSPPTRKRVNSVENPMNMSPVTTGARPVSPLMLADRLLSLAEDAERAGLHRPAERLLWLAYAVCDEKPGA